MRREGDVDVDVDIVAAGRMKDVYILYLILYMLYCMCHVICDLYWTCYM